MGIVSLSSHRNNYFIAAGSGDAGSRVEAAILRDFGRALSKLVKKIDRREGELQEVARRQEAEREKQKTARAVLFSPPASRVSQEWASPPNMNGGAVQQGPPAAINSFQQFSQVCECNKPPFLLSILVILAPQYPAIDILFSRECPFMLKSVL